MFDSPFFHSAVMFRRSVVWNDLGGYDEAFRTSQDFELWSRIACGHELRNLPDVLIDFRTTGSSVSSRYTPEDVDRVRAVLLNNRERYLHSSELAALGLDAWVRVNNPRLGQVGPDLGLLVAADAAMFERFRNLHPEAAIDGEIRRFRSVSLARAAGVGGGCGAPNAFRTLLSAYGLLPAIGPKPAAVYAFRRAVHLMSRRRPTGVIG